MAFIRPTRPTDGVPRRGDPARFSYIVDYHVWSSGRTSLPQVSPPSVTASTAFEVPGVVAPWEFGQHLDVYLLCDAILKANGRSRRGHAVLMFEDATDLLPALVSPPPPGIPPAPAAPPISISLSPSHDSPSPVPNDDKAANFIVSSILQATRPGTPVVSMTSRGPLNSFRSPLTSVVEEPEGEYSLAFTLPTDPHESTAKARRNRFSMAHGQQDEGRTGMDDPPRGRGRRAGRRDRGWRGNRSRGRADRNPNWRRNVSRDGAHYSRRPDTRRLSPQHDRFDSGGKSRGSYDGQRDARRSVQFAPVPRPAQEVPRVSR